VTAHVPFVKSAVQAERERLAREEALLSARLGHCGKPVGVGFNVTVACWHPAGHPGPCRPPIES
jgi:hypothetical protein